MHASLKRELNSSQNDLQMLVEAIRRWVDDVMREQTFANSDDRQQVDHEVRDLPFFRGVIRLIGRCALRLAYEKYCKAQKAGVSLSPSSTCSCTAAIAAGIPCQHRIAIMLDKGERLSPQDFQPAYHLPGVFPQANEERLPQLDVQPSRTEAKMRRILEFYWKSSDLLKLHIDEELSRFEERCTGLILAPEGLRTLKRTTKAELGTQKRPLRL